MLNSRLLQAKSDERGFRNIDSYNSYCYEIHITEKLNKTELEYNVKYDTFTYNHLKDFHIYEREIKLLLEDYVLQQRDFCTFNQIYNFLSKSIKEKQKIPRWLLIPIIFRILNFEKIGPLLIDDQVDEIYLDSSGKSIYIDHSHHGRCTTSIQLSKNEIESFIQRVALENDFSLNRSNPTMKSDFVCPLFHSRVTVDIPPLIIDDIHIDIRKFHSNVLRLPDLVINGSLSLAQAMFLAFLVQNQVTISILGPPNSGKTTLQNALIEYIPPHFRLLSVEDVLEFNNSRKGNIVRFRLGYDPHESIMFTKALEVQKILHRSPDYINLGELSSKNHFTAFLNVLSVGVPTIQTIHGKNTEFLFERLKNIYNIPIELLKTSLPHVFVELNVSWNKNRKRRYIFRISELTKNGKIVHIYDASINAFFSQKDKSPEIFTLEYILKRNQKSLDKIKEDLEKLAMDFSNRSISSIQE